MTVSEFRPICLYDIAAMETWLEDLAKQGEYIHVLTGGFRAQFTEGEPGSWRYRLEPVRRGEKEPDPEKRQIYREFGWEYVTTLKKWYHVWRTDDPAVRELDINPVAQAEAYDRLRSRWYRYIVTDTICLCAVAALLIWQWTETPLLGLVRNMDVKYSVLLLTVLFGMALAVYDMVRLRRELNRLRAGETLRRPAPYRAQRWLTGFFWLLSLVCLVLPPVFGMIEEANGRYRPAEGKQIAYLSLSTLEPLSSGEECDAWYTYNNNSLAKIYRIEDHRHGATEEEGDTESIRLSVPGLTGPLWKELLAWYEENGADDWQEIETPLLDSCCWSRGDGGQYLAAAKGRQLLVMQYTGSADLREHLAEFAAVLDRQEAKT